MPGAAGSPGRKPRHYPLPTIYGRSNTDGYPVKDGKEKECKERARRWWDDYQKKGEKQMLVEGVEAGDGDSPKQAERLAARFPDAAVEPLIRSARRSKEAWVRTGLVRIARGVPGDRTTVFLREETGGPFLASRVAAAEALVARGGRRRPVAGPRMGAIRVGRMGPVPRRLRGG